MRLNSIKLSGFKSFVDPTTFSFPSSMVGVVGPNGCGKSNIIDAVRWVMGESSRHLRGSTMEDVIFNGSSTRSPAGQASVELVFDNSQGRLGGEYAAYTEISVRRQVARDGPSKYFLNGVQCRRKDIVSVFLGTGLGANSYAIIEQGMISRLIDTKPEELRVYLEEAAGISKYKERRRETENRIRHTSENLDRLNDVIDEITKRIGQLKRQARAAEHYKVLKEKERKAKAELLALRWQAKQDEVGTLKQSAERKQTEIEKVIADIRSAESEVDKLRLRHADETKSFGEVQGKKYSLNAEISRVEQAIRHAKEISGHYSDELEQVRTALSKAQQELENEQAKKQELEARIREIEPQLESTRQVLDLNQEKLGDAEAEMADWQENWELLQAKMAGPMQAVEVETSRMQYLESHLEQLKDRNERLEYSLNQCIERRGSDKTQNLNTRISLTNNKLQTLLGSLDEVKKKISEGRDTVQNLRSRVPQAREDLQTTQVRLASLQAMQEMALGRESQAVGQWLKERGLHSAPRLMDTIKTEAGWEAAVETVLGDYLESVCVEDIEKIAASFSQIESGHLTLLDQTPAAQTAKARGTLLDRVQAPVNLTGILGEIHTADDLQQAMKRRKSLRPGQSVITREGVWMGNNWLRLARSAVEQSSVLQRKTEIRELEKKLASKQKTLQVLESDFESRQRELESCEQEREDAQSQLAEAQKNYHQVQSELETWEQEQEHLKQQEEQFSGYLKELQGEISQAQEEMNQSTMSREQAAEIVEEFGSEKEVLLGQRDALASGLEGVRGTDTENRELIHDLSLELESCRSSLRAAQSVLEKARDQVVQLQQRNESLQASVNESDAPLEGLDVQLKELLEQRVDVEHSQVEARSAMQKTEEQIHAKRESVLILQGKEESLQNELSEAKLAWQEAHVRSATLEEQLAEYGGSMVSLIEQLPEDAELEGWEEHVQALGRKITRLGAINLAAISDFEEHQERKDYLDRQHEDLSKALEMLEQAIRKIDKETKDRFKNIFDRVNQRLQEMFPRLFGGGKAFLVMTGDDLLSTGISIMARLPGKRLSSIQLMSGGEKALTAVALVFSLFELNPAPFCLLDEVDAPLDDANVTRYCELLKDMSKQVQFISITHNKSTMEYANQLLGITMSEPGVSRLVSVDIEEAVGMQAVS